MTSTDTDLCHQCGRKIHPNTLDGQCLHCLMRIGLESISVPSQQSPEAGESLMRSGVLSTFGDYELIEEIARGGMGVVYRAWQKSLAREVAVKLILDGQLATTESVRRFRSEAEMAAKLNHPGIVPIFEIGEFQTQHFFSMPLVVGGNLAERVDEFSLHDNMSFAVAMKRQRAIADLMIQVAHAIEYAHQHGILHRDLKPTNILIDEQGRAQLTDFGLAKLTYMASNERTISATILGSPSYMAPEQAQGRSEDVTIATDVYGFGASLYELLCGRPPFVGASILATMRKVIDNPPLSPQRIHPNVHPDMETIILKCLEKKAADRYRSMTDVADDLERFLDGRPIAARPIGVSGQVVRWGKRNPAVATLLALLTCSLVTGFASVVVQWRRAELTSSRLQQTIDRQAWIDIVEMTDRDENSTALAYLAARLRRDPDDWRSSMMAKSILQHRRFTFPAFPAVTHGLDRPLTRATCASDGKDLATVATDNTARLWDAQTGVELQRFGHDAAVTWVQYSPDLNTVLTSSLDATVRIWDRAEGQLLGTLSHDSGVNMVRLDANGSRIASASEKGTVSIWDSSNLQRLGSLAFDNPAVSVQFGIDDDLLVATSKSISIWDIADPENAAIQQTFSASAVFSPQENFSHATLTHNAKFAIGATDRGYCVWDRETGDLIISSQHPSFSPAVHSTTNRVFLHKAERELQVFDLAEKRWLGAPFHPKYLSFSAAFDQSGEIVASGGWDYAIRFQSIDPAKASIESFRVPSVPHGIEFSPDNQSLLVNIGTPQFVTEHPSESNAVIVMRLTEPSSEKTFRYPTGRTLLSAVSPDDQTFVVTQRNKATILDQGLNTIKTLRENAVILGLGFTADGKNLVTATRNGQFSTWNTGTWERELGPVDLNSGLTQCWRLSPDGQYLAAACNNGFIFLWDLISGKQHGAPLVHRGDLNDVNFTHDGSKLVTASDDHTAKIWDIRSGRCLRTFSHDYRIQAAKFSPDDRHLVTGSNDFTAKIWNVETGKQVGATMRHQGEVGNAVFSPDGSKIITSARDGTARIWNASTGLPLTPVMFTDNAIREAHFSPNGRLAVTINHSSFRLWDAGSGLPVGVKIRGRSRPGIGHDSMGQRTPFTNDSSHALWTMTTQQARLCSSKIPSEPVPDWFPDLLETLAGLRLDENDSAVRMSILERLQQRKQLIDIGMRKQTGRATSEYFEMINQFLK